MVAAQANSVTVAAKLAGRRRFLIIAQVSYPAPRKSSAAK
jgi:hypothetical protein